MSRKQRHFYRPLFAPGLTCPLKLNGHYEARIGEACLTSDTALIPGQPHVL